MPTASAKNELFELLGTLCNGSITVAENEHLDFLLSNDPEAQQLYVRYLDIHLTLTDLDLLAYIDSEDMLPSRLIGLDLFDDSSLSADILPPSEQYSSLPSAPHAVSFIPSVYHNTVSFFSQELPFSLLIATLLTSLGLWICSMIYVSSSVEIAQHSTPLRPRATLDPTQNVVGKITGMVDCRWETEGFGLRDWGSERNIKTQKSKSLVFLGDKYTLASGLLEITYDTGAKVILQGPCTYEVESKTGGFLSVGKLTARLEKKRSGVRGQGSSLPSPARGRGAGGEGGQQSEKVASGQWPVASESDPKSRNPEIPKSPIPNPQSPVPAFAVRTPTATVTDIGTEFGVEVAKDGATDTHVFVGVVKLSSCKKDRNRYPELTLSAGQSMQVDRSGTINQKNVAHLPIGFVRRLPDRNTSTEYSKTVLADKPLFYWNFDELEGAAIEQIRHQSNQQLYPMGRPRRSVHTAIGSGLALGRAADFSKAAGCFRSSLLQQGTMPGAWAIEFWAQFTGDLLDHATQGIMDAGAESQYGRYNPAILFNGSSNDIGNTFIAAGCGYKPGNIDHCTRGGPQITDHLWHHVLVVFYGNGSFGVVDRVDIIVDAVKYTVQRHDFTSGFDMVGMLRVGATQDDLSETFQGRIDELAFYDLSMSTVQQIEHRAMEIARRHIQIAKLSRSDDSQIDKSSH